MTPLQDYQSVFSLVLSQHCFQPDFCVLHASHVT